LEKLALHSDLELAKQYGAEHVSCLRWDVANATADEAIRLARQGVVEGLSHARAGRTEEAKTALLDAYLLGVERVEPMLLQRDDVLLHEVERTFVTVRSAVDGDGSGKGNPKVLERDGKALLRLLDRVCVAIKPSN
jgi:high-affinity iron transporter